MQKLNNILEHTGRRLLAAEPKDLGSIRGTGVYAEGNRTRNFIEKLYIHCSAVVGTGLWSWGFWSRARVGYR
jgi:hypothetical protein